MENARPCAEGLKLPYEHEASWDPPAQSSHQPNNAQRATQPTPHSEQPAKQALPKFLTQRLQARKTVVILSN